MAQPTERIVLDLPAELRYLRIVGTSVQELLGGEEADHIIRHDIELALQEICVNIVVHAYAGREAGRLDLVLSKSGREFVADITDRGEPFDPGQAPAPNLDEGQVHGYGMFMASQLLDEVTYDRRDGLNHWRLTKRWT